jgi:hypothetical protein
MTRVIAGGAGARSNGFLATKADAPRINKFNLISSQHECIRGYEGLLAPSIGQECVQRANVILELEPLLPHACMPISEQRKGSTIRIRGGLALWQIR